MNILLLILLVFITSCLAIDHENVCSSEQAGCLDTYEKKILKEGTGELPKKGQKVTVHCTGYGKNNDLSLKFWSTKDPGQKPFAFEVGTGKVIKAWDEGVMTMKTGEISMITSSPKYAYGERGFASWGILPNSILKFEIEVLSIQ